MEKAAIIVAMDESGLQPVFTIPSVRRLVLLIQQAGISNIYILGCVHAIMPVLSDLVGSENFYPLPDPSEISRISDKLPLADKQRVLVAAANTVVDRLTLCRLLSADDGIHLFFMQAEGGSAFEGFYLGDAKDLISLVPRIRSEAPGSGNANTGMIRIQGAAGLPCVLDEKPDAIACSEDRLVGALSAQTEASDGFLARHIDRRISRFISRRLCRTRIRPNQITLIGVTIGLSGAFLLSRTEPFLQFIGAFLFLFCVVVDGVDGEVARLKLQETRFGHYLDIITDNVVHIAVFAGVAFGLYRGSGEAGYLYALGYLVGGFALCAVAAYDCILRRRSKMLSPSTRMLRLMTLLSNRDFAYLIVVLAAAQRLNWFLIGAAVGSYLFAATLWTLRFFENRAVNQNGA